MTDRTGLGIVETGVLHAVRHAQLRLDAVFTKCARLLDVASTDFGVGRRWAYEALCDLGRPEVVNFQLIDFHGNCGSNDFPPAPPEFTEARLSPAGVLALNAEDGVLAPLPLGLMLGDTYVDGRRPPFEPLRMIKGVGAVLADPTIDDAELIRLVGPPVFPSRCQIGGDVDTLIAGHPCVLELSCRMDASADGSQLVLTSLPPRIGTGELTDLLEPGADAWVGDRDWPYEAEDITGISRVWNGSEGDADRVVCVVEPGTDLVSLKDQLRRRWGVTTRVSAQLPAPLPALLRDWAEKHSSDNLAGSLTKLRAVLQRGNSHPMSWRGVVFE